MDHSDLSGHYYMGTPGGPSNPGVDEFIHGTLLAGTIGAVTNNNEGIAGVFGPPPSAPIRLMSAKFFEAHHFVTSYNASVAVWVAVDLGADVINASWDVGVAADYLNPIGSTNDSLRLAIEHAVMQNVVVVAAAGNDGTDNDVWPTWPARYSGVIAVMATDRNDARPAFSNYGAKTVHIAAPGVDVLSTYSYRWGAQGTFAPTKYHPYTGTSPAAAHVSGAAALLRALQPGWSATMLRDHLIASADPVPWLTCVARGRLNLRRAVRGPIRITVPSKGDTWTRNTLEQVYWQLDYQTPAVKTVTISLETGPPPTPPIVLAQGVLNNGANGACSVWVPNVTTYQARIKIVSDQAAFIYAESGHFSIQ
jgi:subtilisin family serine protease